MPEPLPRPATNPLGLPFLELQSVDSTNNYARQQIHAGLAQHGMTVFAHEQRAGKGQRGRSWTSEKAANIMMSLILEEPGLELTEQFHLSACISVAIQDFLSKYAGTDTKIKWPNDVYWQDRKAGGLLIESVIAGSTEVGSRESGVGSPESRVGSLVVGSQKHDLENDLINPWRWAIVGIGINVNQTSFPTELKNAVSLKQITGKDFNTVELAKELVSCIQQRYDQVLLNGFEEILLEYNQHLYKKDEIVKLKKHNQVFETKIISVTAEGKLNTMHAFQQEFDFGEVAFQNE